MLYPAACRYKWRRRRHRRPHRRPARPLTAYDSGGLEIKSLRTEAQAALGARFDVREFNRTVLDEGIVPLGELRRHVESWINSKK